MLCHYHLLVCLSCFVANCWSSTSEYLIIRHGRSRVRHSSEKDHIRWGLQVFDNFTLLDYDTVDDSNETSSTGELRSLVKKAGKGRIGVDQFSDNSNNSDTLTIQFSESEELDRMIDISDFDSISIESGGGSSGRQQASFNSWRNNRTLNLPFSVDSIQRFTPIMPTAQGQKLVPKGVPQKKKLIKKEIMENIRKTVDKGLEYLKSHKNLDEVKIELKPFRARTKGTKNGNERLAHSSNPDTLLRKVIPSHERSPPAERKKNELKHVNGNRKDYTQVSSPFSVSIESAIASDGDQLQSAESELQHSITYLKEKYWKNVKINNDYTFFRPLSTATLERKQILTVTTASPENNDYPNDSPLLANGGDHRYPFASSDTANEATSWTDQGEKKSGPINGKTDRGNNAEEKFNYELRKQSFDSLSTETFQNDGPDGPADDEVINILNDTPTMSFEPNEADAPSTIIFNGADLDAAPDSDSSNSDDPLNWVSDAADSPDDVGTSDNNGDEADMSEIFRMEDIDLSELDETSRNNRRNLMKGRDVVTKFLQIVESQHLLGSNCTAGTALNLGEGVVDRYAQDRFRVEAEIAVNRANMLTRIFKFSSSEVQASEHLLHASVLSMVEFDDDIFAAGNCFDWNQHSAKKGLFCPFAYRLPPPDQGASLAKDLAAEYHYLGNTSEWFFLARKNAEKSSHGTNSILSVSIERSYFQRLHGFEAGM
nr:uncharacterized protein LOC115259212 isoform X1 [Aedes albopictus]